MGPNRELLESSFNYVKGEADAAVFADEVHRFKFLQTIPKVLENYHCQLAAFCILPDSIHLLLHTNETQRLSSRSAARMIFASEELYLPQEVRSGEYILREQESGWVIHEGGEAQRFCADIHLLPIRKGWVPEVNYFWFSSWQTYRGIYNWTGLKTECILRFIAEDQSKAVRLFRRYQKMQEKNIEVEVRKNAGPYESEGI